MALTLTPEQEQQIQEKIDRGEASPELEAAFSSWTMQKYQRDNPQLITPETPRTPVQPPPKALPRQLRLGRPDVSPSRPAARTPETQPPTGSLVEASPLYQQYLEQVGREAMTPPPLIGEASVPPPDLVSPGAARQQRRAVTTNEQQTLREILEFAPTLLAPLLGPAALASKPLQAALTFGIQDLANRAANAVDPSQYRNPEAGAALNAGGELLFNVAGSAIPGAINKTRQLLNRTFGETAPWGTMQREVFEDLGMPSTPLAVRSEKPAPRWIDYAMQHTPFGGRLYDIYALGEKRLDDAFQTMKARVGKVGHVTDYLDTLGTGVAGRADETLLDTTPPLLRGTFRSRLDDVKKTIDTVYGDVDQQYFGAQIPWTMSGHRLTPWRLDDLMRHPELQRLVEDPAHSIFGRTVQLMDNLEAMGPTVSLDTARDLGRTVDAYLEEAYTHLREIADQNIPDVNRTLLTQSIEDRVIPALGKAKAQIEQAISPYMVDLRVAKEEADRLIKPYFETVPGQMAVAEPQVLEGITGRAGYTQDPLIANAMELSKQPNFVTFTEANQLRSKLLEVSRLPGPNLGNTTAERGKQLAMKIGNAMDETGRVDPGLLPRYRAAQGYYKDQAEVWNSDLIMENMGKNLDDLMTTMIKNERPNDFKTLRSALGDDVFDQAAEMWLTRKILGNRTGGLRQIEAKPLLAELDGMSDVALRELFPGGINEVTDALRKMVNTEDAVGIINSTMPDAAQLRQLKNAINDPVAWEAVQNDVIAGWLRPGRDPLDGQKILDHLERMSDINTLVFTPGQLRELGKFGSTMRQVQSIHGAGATQWSPVVRKIEHGLLLTILPVGAAWATGDWKTAAAVPAAYILGNWGMGRILTNEKVLSLLTQGLRTPLGSIPGARLSGRILGELAAQNLLEPTDVIQVQGQGTPTP